MRRPANGILLDEPALGLDSVHKATFAAPAAGPVRPGRVLVLFSTHDLELALQADQLVLMGEDGIIAEGQAAELIKNEAAWAEIGLARPAWVDLPT